MKGSQIMDSLTCQDRLVSEVKMQRSPSAREINCVPNEPLPLYFFMDDTYLDPTEKRNELDNELYKNYKEHIVQLYSLRKSTSNQGKKPTQRIDVLGRFVHLIASVRRTKHPLMYKSSMKHKTVHGRRRVKLPLPRNIRQIMEEDSENNLCQAVQEMRLNSENSVRTSKCTLPRNVESPSEVAEDLSKLRMKD